MATTTGIFVRFNFEAFHCWPDAPEEHAYLRPLHRHVFHVCAWREVDHADRDVEFIALKRRMEAYCRSQRPEDTATWSCETWALALLAAFNMTRVEVSEDGENGGYAER